MSEVMTALLAQGKRHITGGVVSYNIYVESFCGQYFRNEDYEPVPLGPENEGLVCRNCLRILRAGRESRARCVTP